jgi:hypothetical protein
MTPAACPREAAVLAALEGRVPVTNDASSIRPDDLASHLADCAACAELATARLVAGVHANDLQSANVPSAGQVWWRAQVRARAEARRAAERPMQIVHAVSAACAAGALAAGVGWAWPWIQTALSGAATSQLAFAWWLAIGAWLIIAPVALYFVFARE